MDTNLVSKNLNYDVFENRQKNLEKKMIKSVKSLASGKENVRFPDSPDFENLPAFRNGCDVRIF